jgi:PAS domain S-box-containing protein
MLQQLRTSLNDEFRLAALRHTGLLDSPTEESFDRLTRLAVQLFSAPVALVSVVDEGRQFFKSCVGVSEPLATSRQTPLSHSFCQHVVNTAEPLIVEDARQHPLVWDNLAISDFGVIAYAGIPLITSEGHVLGSFCVLGYEPRQWKEQEISILKDLAASVMTEIELRLRTRQLEEQREVSRVSEERFELFARASNDVLWEYDQRTDTVWWSENLQLFGYAPEQMNDSHTWKEKIHPEDRERVLATLRITAEQAREHWVNEYRFRCADGEYKHVYDRGHVIYDTEQKPTELFSKVVDGES